MATPMSRPCSGLAISGPTCPSAPSCVPSPPRAAALGPRTRLVRSRARVPPRRVPRRLAVTTLVFHVPKFNGFIDALRRLGLPRAARVRLAAALPPAAAVGARPPVRRPPAGLLLGWARAFARGFSPRVGAWVMLLDPEHYSHNAHFHLTLLALVGCASDGLSLRRSCSEDDGDASRCPAWPEHLVRLQVAIVFFYAALDKVFSPFWGMLGGSWPPGLDGRPRPRPRAWLQRPQPAPLSPPCPACLSVATIATEFSLAPWPSCCASGPSGLVVGLRYSSCPSSSWSGPASSPGTCSWRGSCSFPRATAGGRWCTIAGVRGMSAESRDPVAARLA